MRLSSSLCLLASLSLAAVAGAAEARDLTTVWDTKQKCFRTASTAECGTTYNVTTRTYGTAGAPKEASGSEARVRPTDPAPAPAPLPSQTLRTLGEPEAPAEPDTKEETGAKPTKPAEPAAAKTAAAKPTSTQDEWDVASPAKKAKTAESGATEETKKPVKKAEPTARPRGIRRTKAEG